MSLDERADSLTESVHEQVGDGLRGVLSYRHTGEIKVHYVRDDIDQELTESAREGQIQEFLQDIHAADTQEDRFGLGALDCTVRFFDDATVLNFILDGEVGVVISLDPGTHIITRKFITHCKEHVMW